MAQITTRGANRSELTHKQVDDNFINLNKAVIAAQTTADNAVTKAGSWPSLKELSGRIRISPNNEDDDATHTLQVNGSLRTTDRVSLGGLPNSESFRVNQSQSGTGQGGRLEVTGGSAAGLYPRIQSINPAVADSSISYGTQSAGVHRFYTNSVGGLEQVRILHLVNVISYLTMVGGVSGSGPTISAGGTASAIPLVISSKGASPINFQGNGALQFQVGNTASAVNYGQVTGGAAGNAVTFSALGTDTNIDISLVTKGTGVLRFGTFVSSVDVPVVGYVTIKDSANNIRKLAVIS